MRLIASILLVLVLAACAPPGSNSVPHSRPVISTPTNEPRSTQ